MGDDDGNDFLSSFKKNMNDSPGKGKSIIEELQITIKERENTINERDAKIVELESKIKELTLMAKDAFLAPRSPGQARRGTSDDPEALNKEISKLRGENDALTEQLVKLKDAEKSMQKLEARIDAQKKEILDLKQKKDFDLSQFTEEGDDPVLVSQIRVLKTRVKTLEKRLSDDHVDDLKERVAKQAKELDDSKKSAKALNERIKELEAKIEILEKSPPPPAPVGPTGPPAPPSMPGFPSMNIPGPATLKSTGPPSPFSAPPPPPPSPFGAGLPAPPAPPSAPAGVFPTPPSQASPQMHSVSQVSGGGASELQKQFKDLQEKYMKLLKDIDEFKVSDDPQAILNLKTMRIDTLQDEVKRLYKEVKDNPDAKALRAEIEARDAQIQERDKQIAELNEKMGTVAQLESEKATLIQYYTDLKMKYEQIYYMIQERDQVIMDLQQRLGMM